MKVARNIVSQALEHRDKAGIKVRQPLRQLTVTSEQFTGKYEKELFALIADEINVKEVVAGPEIRLDTKITPELEEEGVVRDAIRTIQDARKKAKLNPKEHANLAVDFGGLDTSAIKRNLDHIQKETNTTIGFSSKLEPRT